MPGNFFSDPYDPIFYAQEALAQVELAMGMAGRVYRGFDEEKKSATKGSVISIRKPSNFVVTEGGAGNFQDINTDAITMTVDNWKEVKFKLTDKEIALHQDVIIEDHIRPAAYALAKYVNTKVAEQALMIPWVYDMPENGVISDQDIIGPRQVIRHNTGDMIDSGMLHFGFDDVVEGKLLGLDIFKNASVAGDNNNKAIFNGSLGVRYNIENFVDQTLPVVAGGSIVSATDREGTISAALKGATSVSVAALEASATIKAGDTFVLAGNEQRYVATADVTLSAAGAGSVPIYPSLVQDYADGTTITFESAASTNAEKYSANVMFHKNAFALAFAPLPEIGNGIGARMATITDPKTKISIRSRVAYYDKEATIGITLDILFGCKTINDKYGCRVRRKVV